MGLLFAKLWSLFGNEGKLIKSCLIRMIHIVSFFLLFVFSSTNKPANAFCSK